MSLNKIARKQYQKFSSAEGSQYICSEYALTRILKIIKRFEPEKILEVGIGIGTISDSILKADFNFKSQVYGTEKEEFCLKHLPINMGQQFKELELFSDIQSLPPELKFDLIIIDGKEKALDSLKNLMSLRCIVVIEGDRKDQTEILNRLFSRSKFVHSITSKRNNTYSNRPLNHFQGGLKIIFTKPNFKQYVEWSRLRLISKINFELRKLAR